MAEPRAWSLAELTEDTAAATDRFRRSRLNEPLEQYTGFFETFTPVFADLIDRLPSLADEENVRNAMADLVADDDVRTGFRYLSAPPISEDDLKILTGTTLAANVLRGDAEQARRIRDVVLHIIDPHRFPWIGEEREPTQEEPRKDRTLALASDAHVYEKPGRYHVLVKVIDIFGNDTSQGYDVEV